MKNRRRNDKNGKIFAIASAAGIAVVVVSLIAAYSATMKRLVPTGTSTSSSSWVFTSSNSSSDVPVQNNVQGVPKNDNSNSSSKPDSSSSESAAEVNKPVKPVEIGNILPVKGEVSHPFSNGELVKSETLGVWKTHDGCDILCAVGTDVLSMSEGTVKEIKDDPLWGVYVVVEQGNGLEVHYCGLAKELNVKAGQQINQGEIIGKTGETNQAEVLQQPHLHLAVKSGGEWVDPLSVIDSAV